MYVGDDKGNVYMYNLKKVIKQGKKSDQYLRPSRVSRPANKILEIFMIIPEFRFLRPTFHGKSATRY